MGSELEKLRKKLGLDEERVKNSTPQTSGAGSNLSQLRKSLGLDGQGSTSRVTYSSDDIAPVSKKVQSRMTVGNYLSGNASMASSSYAAKQNDDIAPTKGKKVDFFKKGAFEDGYDFGDITKTILGTAGDAGLNVVKGAGSLVEGVTDLAQYGAAGVADAMGEDAWADKTRKRAQENRIEEWTQGLTDYFDKNSVLAKTSDSILQGIGQVGGILATGGLGAAAGLSGAGVTALTTGVMGLSGAGSGMGEAYESGATDEEAAVYGAISGAADALTELVFGGLGKTVNALGFSKGLSSADDMIAKAVSDKFKNQIAKNITQFGVKAGAEGLEEVMAGFLQAAGKKATYMSEKDFKEILEDENLMEQFIVGSMTSGMIQSGLVPGTKNGSLVEANKTGSDFLTGLSKNETAVVKKEVENRIAEIEKKGEKLTAKQKSNLEAEVISAMERGDISIDTIEEVLGGEKYNQYKQISEWEDSLQTEFDTLNKMKQGDMTGEQVERREALRNQIKNVKATSGRTQLKTQIRDEVMGLVRGDGLAESYNQRYQSGQKFEADLTQYDAKHQETVQKAIDSGILNNSRRTHEFVDFVSKISADTGVLFDFSNTAKLREAGYVMEGQTIDGLYNPKEGITVNIDSPKSRQFVVGHEITHALEGTELYNALRKSVFDYAKMKNQYGARMESIQKRYKEGTDFEAELTADLVGEYIFSDTDFINNLSTQNRNVFQKVFDEIKYLCKVATAGSKEARELERVKRAFEKAYREGGKAQRETKYSVSETTDGRFAAVVDSNILSNIDTSSWDKETKNAARKAASEALKQFSDGIVVDGITRKVNRTSRMEYTRSKYTEKLFNRSPDMFADKMRAADVADDIVVVATNWQRDGGLKHPRTDNFVDFDHGNTLIVSGDAKYSAEVVVGIMDTGEAILYDVVDMAPATFDIKKEEPPTIATTQNAIGNAHGNSFADNVSPTDNNVKYSLPDTDGKQLNNEKPTADPDIRHSMSEVTEEQNEKGLDRKSEVIFSLSNDTAYMDKAIAKNNSMMKVDGAVLNETKALRGRIAARMNAIKDRGLVGLPEDIEGNTYIANSSYDGTEENTTICPRSLASEAFVDAVSEYLGRPLSVNEQIYISQDLQGRSLTPECTYCYVATDRKAYRAFLGEYVAQRDSVLQKVQENPSADVSRSGELYKEFLNGRKDTNPMFSRFKMWVDAYKNGKPMIDASHLANINKLMGDINSEFGAELKPQIVDAMKYAQSASWAKKRVNYVAYNGHILNWKQDRINKLNSHYGLRMYSFSDFHPAFVLENMQMITDASVRGLKMLGYTKDTDFVDIFAPSGMNINVSTFGFEAGGEVFENNLIGAEWEKAKALRDQYPNVGVTFVATNDTLVDWALNQDWVDVVIPFHLVRTGREVAKAFNYHDYTSESSDMKTKDWKKGDKKYIAPTEHNNDKATYLAALEQNHLKPRFERFINNPNYMKLVNECRQPASESKPVQPVFNEDAAMVALAKLEANGYYHPIGGSVDRMYEIAGEVADAMTNQLAPVMSLSNTGEQHTPDSLSALRLETTEDFSDIAPTVSNSENATPVRGTDGGKTARVLTEAPQKRKKSNRAWSLIKEHILDNGMVFETLSKKTKNRELEAKWNFIRNTDSAAQHLIGQGDKAHGVKALKAITDTVNKSGKTEKFYQYLLHRHNVDRMTLQMRYGTFDKAVFGDNVTATMSQQEADSLLKANPEFASWAEDIYTYNRHLRDMMVDANIITQETADLWEQMYPHYVPVYRAGEEIGVNNSAHLGVGAPVNRATGGNQDILPLFDSMAQRTLQTYKAIAKNNFGVELKNTLDTVVEHNPSTVDDFTDSFDMDNLLTRGGNGINPTYTVYENGQRVTFQITDEMYDAMKPKNEFLSSSIPVVSHINSIFRGLTTEYNPTFMFTNPIKDVQDVLLNSQHPLKTYGNILSGRAVWQMLNNGVWYQEYIANGGESNTYFDRESNEFKEESKLKKYNPITWLNDKIEMTPRLAEYIASREAGRSIEVSMLDAARVTTNFAAGGDLTKFANRNGATFLNASVQGAIQTVRNVREANQKGLMGYVGLATRLAIAGLPAMIMNGMLWDDDEDYEKLADYVKQNYYIVSKTDDGRFIRIPKGRTLAVIQNAFEQVSNALTGDDEVDFGAFLKLAAENLAPNNPFDNNIIAPIMQVKNNRTWYGEDLIPSRLQDLPAVEQYDEKTDTISRAIAESDFGRAMNISPYKVNYLMNQYGGGAADFILPFYTPRAESGDDSDWGKAIAPMRDKFTTDSVLNSQTVTDFYDKTEELEVMANSMYATEEDKFKSMYLKSISYETGDLYAQKREIQNSDMSDSAKYRKTRDIQKQINELMETALNSYEDYRLDGKYGEVGGRRYNYDSEKDTWYEIKPTKADGSENYYYQKEQDITKAFGISYSDYWNNREEYDNAHYFATSYGKNMLGLAKNIYGRDFVQYASDLSELKSDKDKYGNSISGSKKKKVEAYVYGLDIPEVEKHILFKSQYNSDDSHNREILEYLDERTDISYDDWLEILNELGFKVDSKNYVTW